MRLNGIPKPSSKRPDRIQAALESDLNAQVESFEERRALHEGKIDGKQRAYNTMVEHSRRKPTERSKSKAVESKPCECSVSIWTEKSLPTLT